MGRKSKAKGSSFERKICKALSLWVSGGKKQDCYWRSAMSGGRASVAMRGGTELARQCGDITAVAPEGHVLTARYYIECKCVKSLGTHLFMLKGGLLYSFWQETREQASKYKRAPMLIAKENNSPTLVVVPALMSAPFNQPASVHMIWWSLKNTYIEGACIVMRLDELLKQKLTEPQNGNKKAGTRKRVFSKSR